jgi:hypothetical protein
LRHLIARETGSLGVRGYPVGRWPATRALDEVSVEGLPVRVKVSPGRVKIEHDDAARAARRLGMPLREVVSRAEEAWRDQIAGREGRDRERQGAERPAGMLESGESQDVAEGEPAPVVDMVQPERDMRQERPGAGDDDGA